VKKHLALWRNPNLVENMIGTVAVRWRRGGRLKLSSARANSSTGLSCSLFMMDWKLPSVSEGIFCSVNQRQLSTTWPTSPSDQLGRPTPH